MNLFKPKWPYFNNHPMKKLAFLLLLLSNTLFAQSPEFDAPLHEVEGHLRFLASDALMGRKTGAPGNQMAAAYIASQLQTYGVKTLPGAPDYFQQVALEEVSPPLNASLKIGKQSYDFKKDFIMLVGEATALKTSAVYAGHGWVDEQKGVNDYANIDVKGKVVFVITGLPDDNSPATAIGAINAKRMFAQERGAVALIELYRLSFPFGFAVNYFSKPSTRLADKSEGPKPTIAYGWIKEKGADPVADIVKGKTQKIALSNSAGSIKPLNVPNVIGFIEGSDPAVSSEYLLISAHFDHVGVGSQGGGAVTETDSIFNGARDNAMGVSALLLTARTLAQQKPRRSVIFLACNAEEIGLLGSRFYTENPLVPLKQVIFNLNVDGAGYNDTTAVAAIGYGRTGTDELIQSSAAAFGLSVIPNPVPDQNLFDRSDNVSFSAKGVPSLSLSPGLNAFDAEISKYYHQVADNPETVNMAYFHRYSKAFAHLARLIANHNQVPKWIAGDKYESIGNELYGQ
jgi:hypothetical protein